jgi:hypothetical protein
MRARLLVLGGDYADVDWLDPASPPPDNARQIRVTRSSMKLALRGRAGTADSDPVVSLGAMTVDAYAATELDGGGYTRGKSIAEVEGTVLDGSISLIASDLTPGSTARIHLTLAGVVAPVIELLVLEGGRVL